MWRPDPTAAPEPAVTVLVTPTLALTATPTTFSTAEPAIRPTTTLNVELTATPALISVRELVDERAGLGFSYPQDWELTEFQPGHWILNPAPGAVVQVLTQMIGPSTVDDAVSKINEVFTLVGFTGWIYGNLEN